MSEGFKESFESGMLPGYAEDFLVYIETILGKSKNTVKEYSYDLLMFFRYMKLKRKLVKTCTPFEEIKADDFELSEMKSITLTDLYSFLNYINNERRDQAPTRARKVACLRSFYKYLCKKACVLKDNIAAELESPKLTKKLPRYLDLDESKHLLDSIDGDAKERDYCIITLFLNCGMRLSELVGIDVADIRRDTLVVTGKGAKERTIYLNDACLDAIDRYLLVREDVTEVNGAQPLFLSNRKKRISPKTVQYTVKKFIQKASLDPTKYSTHKLRHTAATLMYTYGDVDIRTLQEILGHESVSTTEIYTHVNNPRLKEAVKKNPLAEYTSSDKDKDDE